MNENEDPISGDLPKTSDAAACSRVLKDDLTRRSLLLRDTDPHRKVWWMNTVCLVILSVGVVGFERVLPFMPRAIAALPPAFQIDPPKETEERTLQNSAATETSKSVENEPPPPPAVPEPVPFRSPGPDGFSIVVPKMIEGDGLGEPIPRVRPNDGEGRSRGENSGPARFEQFSGHGKRGKHGYVPEPELSDMPRALQDELPRGKVLLKLAFTVSTGGKIVEIHVVQSSGNRWLDRFMMDWYKRRGTFVAGPGERVFAETLILRLPE